MPSITPPTVHDTLPALDKVGCNACHVPGPDHRIRSAAPDLTTAGSRYQATYLNDYLLNPQRVRNHIGAIRMPDFRLDPTEAAHLTAFLKKSNTEPLPVSLSPLDPDPDLGKKLFSQLSCTACHAFEGEGNAVVSDLTNSGSKLTREWLVSFLAFPDAYQSTPGAMPSFFFEYRDGQYYDRNANSNTAIQALADYLLQGAAPTTNETGGNAQTGEVLYESLNCTSCHSGPEVKTAAAPSLNKVWDEKWLADYLKAPYSVRPLGYPAGTQSRMPSMKLGDEEIAELMSVLPVQSTAEEVQKLSRHTQNKIEMLLVKRYACTGCHTVNGKGGRLGPDLARVRERLSPGRTREIIAGHRRDSLSIMPVPMLDDARIDEIVAFLYQAEIDPDTLRITFGQERSETNNLYKTYCASCHGIDGRGNGINAPYLTTTPTNHADSTAMSARTDDTLFDGIYNGGYILNKSHQMPGFGKSLTRDQITELVAYIRQLCNCSEPEWATSTIDIQP